MPSHEAKPLEDQGSASAEPTQSRRSYARMVILVSVAVGSALLIGSTRRRFWIMFEEFELDLPAITFWGISTPWMLVVLLLVAVAAIAKEAVVARDQERRLVDLLLLLVVIVCVLFYVIGVATPLLKLMQALS